MEDFTLPMQVDWEQQTRLTRRLLQLLSSGGDVEIALLTNEEKPESTGLQGHVHQLFWEIRLFRPSDEEPISRIVLIPPGVRHHLIQQAGKTKVIHYRIGENVFETTWVYPGYGHMATEPSQQRMILRHLEMMRDYRQTYGEESQVFLNSQTHFLGRALLSLAESARTFTERHESRAVRGDSAYVAALKYINAHYRDPALTIAEIARFVGLCENGLSRIFRRHLGISARRYLILNRLGEACNLLAQGEASIALVARLCGWNTTGYFLAVFRKVVGMTAREFQAKCRGGEVQMPEVLLKCQTAVSADLE